MFSENEAFKVLDTSAKKTFSVILSPLEDSDLLNVQPCAWTHLYASAAGRAMLHVTLSIELQPSRHFKDSPILLKAVSSLAAYSPLVIRQSKSGNQFGGYSIDLTRMPADTHDADHACLDDLYLAPGSGMDVLLTGGPERWNQNIEHIELVEVATDEEQLTRGGLLVQRVSSTGEGLYSVLCETLGEFVSTWGIEENFLCSLSTFLEVLGNQ